jgi:predicted secreted protein
LEQDDYMVLNEQDSSRTVYTGLAETITVCLNENPSTGYCWTVEIATGMEKISDNFRSGEAIGSTGMRELRFKTTKIGTNKLHLKNWREWEGENSVIARFRVTVIVK